MNNFPYTYAAGKIMTRKASEPNQFGISQPARYEEILFRKLNDVVEVRVTRQGYTPEWHMNPSNLEASHSQENSFKRYMKHLKNLSRGLTEVSIGQRLASHDSYGHEDPNATLLVTGWSKKINDAQAAVLKTLTFV